MATSSINTNEPPAYDSLGYGAPSSQSGPPPHATKTRNGIPPSSRRSMEDERRPLPQGWIRQYDRELHHQFFVDTKAEPPRSIWQHPYDDNQYLQSLPAAERNRIHQEGLSLQRKPSIADIEAESSEDDHDDGLGNSRGDVHGSGGRTTAAAGTGEEHIGATHRFGRRMKDKLTGSTHQQREEKRRQRAAAEQRAYEQHQRFRAAMVKAEETGEPQLLGTDKDGKEVYIEPPSSYGGGMGFGGLGGGMLGGGGMGMGRGMYGNNGYGFDPYSQGIYSNPSGRYMRPQSQYYRPYGYGYGGGGLGMGLGMGAMGGLGTGMLLGDMMWL